MRTECPISGNPILETAPCDSLEKGAIVNRLYLALADKLKRCVSFPEDDERPRKERTRMDSLVLQSYLLELSSYVVLYFKADAISDRGLKAVSARLTRLGLTTVNRHLTPARPPRPRGRPK
ncbi:hypothetical protein EVAR_63894_1 [Eumeta japonica]|uniref:Uncharacterized protein n=1 Tax=Eumeta variegata TaxID=151549 RepID=A0A4C1ZNH0_EUMVA|nr:hypothetical protein EVAR_63894_1 [Eumeta japonica]